MEGNGKMSGDDKPALRLEWRSPSELAENPSNWRRHPPAQLSALTDVISDVGWAGACLYNERTNRLIDGHARRKVALDQGTEKVPVLVGDWSEEQERKILATLDPLAAMAEADKDRLDALLREVQTGSQAVGDLLTELAKKAGSVPSDRELADSEGPDGNGYKEQYGVIVLCENEDRQKEVFEELRDRGYTVRVVAT